MPHETIRFEQLEALSSVQVEGLQLRLHGSVGHAAMQGVALPSAMKRNGELRDIDLYHPDSDKATLEASVGSMYAGKPHPIDAGLCELLKKDGDTYVVSKDGVEVELAGTGVFEDTVPYEVAGSDGLIVYGFSQEAALAIHSLEPRRRVLHYRSDRQFNSWAQAEGVQVPQELARSIDRFHKEYNQRYPFAPVYEQLSQVYVRVIPEGVRTRLRTHTHRFMAKHAGRHNPFETDS